MLNGEGDGAGIINNACCPSEVRADHASACVCPSAPLALYSWYAATLWRGQSFGGLGGSPVPHTHDLRVECASTRPGTDSALKATVPTNPTLMIPVRSLRTQYSQPHTFVPVQVSPSYAPPGKTLVSVSTVGTFPELDDAGVCIAVYYLSPYVSHNFLFLFLTHMPLFAKDLALLFLNAGQPGAAVPVLQRTSITPLQRLCLFV